MRKPGGKIVIDLGYTEGRMSVVLHIPVAEELLPLIDRRARAKGLQREEYLRDVIAHDLVHVDDMDSALAAVRAEFEASGMTEEDLADLVDAARTEIWQEKQAALK